MKKHIKWSLLLALAASAVLLPSTAVFGATDRWREVDGSWYYYKQDDRYTTDRWIKDNGKWYYLGSDGRMVTNMLIQTGDPDGTYYVDETGARVVNTWVVNPDRLDEEEESRHSDIWYYFGKTGRAETGQKTIDGQTYIFDDDGIMLTGWQFYSRSGGEEHLYYLGGENEGYAHTGWQYLELTDDMITDDSPYFYDNREWFYFSNSGKAYRGILKKIGENYYEFDENGVMLEGWQGGSGEEDDPLRYYNYGTGERIRGWAWVPAPDDPEGERYFYFFEKDGTPFNGEGQEAGGEGAEYTDIGHLDDPQSGMAMMKTNGEVYLFNDQGQMQTGLFELTDVPLGNEVCTDVYYFEGEKEVTVGERQSGQRTLIQEEERRYFHFRQNGRAYENCIKDQILYGPGGYRIEAEDTEYRAYQLTEDTFISEKGDVPLPAGTTVLVNKSGKVQKNKTVTIDGRKWAAVDYVAAIVPKEGGS